MISKPDEMGASELLAPIVTYEFPPGRWSAATAAGLLFYGVSRAEAEARLTEAGITTPLVSCDALTWRSTLTAAFASEIEGINSTLEGLPQSSDVEEIKSRQEVISENLAALSAGVAAEQSRRAEIAELQRALRLMEPSVRAALPGNPTDDEVRQVLNATYHARRLKEIQ